MYQSIQLKTKILFLKNSINRPPLRCGLFLMPLALACFALSPGVQAVNPPPDGGYPGGNTAEGFNALFNLSTQDGAFNTAVGFYSLFSNTTGSLNTAVGAGALDLNTGHNNTATGAGALLLNTTGSNNTAVGAGTLASNTAAEGNTGVGAVALALNTTGAGNTALGAQALTNNTAGDANTAVGVYALAASTSSTFKTAVGAFALMSDISGIGRNTAVGGEALILNTTGASNTAIGGEALVLNTTGSGNIAVGRNAGGNLTTGDNNIDIGNGGVADESNAIRIGEVGTQMATFIAGINGVDQGSPTAVFINTTTGQLGTTPPSSSRRFKKDIKPMDKVSEAILGLKPVTFQYRSDNKDTPQFGLIAEEVAEANPDLVMRDEKGEIYTVRYEAVNAMLLNEFLKARHQIDVQQKQIDALTAGLQKVSARIEVSKPAPQTVQNDQ
jgi:hypothetical protein